MLIASYSCLRKYCSTVLSMLEECGNGPGQNARSYNIAISACSRASQWEKAIGRDSLGQAPWHVTLSCSSPNIVQPGHWLAGGGWANQRIKRTKKLRLRYAKREWEREQVGYPGITSTFYEIYAVVLLVVHTTTTSTTTAMILILLLSLPLPVFVLSSVLKHAENPCWPPTNKWYA